MEKPPFQFGLKAVFGVMTGIAVLMATIVHAPELLIGIGVLAIAGLLVLGCLYAVWVMAGLLMQLFDWLQKAPPDA